MKYDPPRVSIVNCVSTALDLLKFSSEDILTRAGEGDFDYFIVCWLASKEVDDYVRELQERTKHSSVQVYRLAYETNPKVHYIPNLRGMMNLGFEVGSEANPYFGLVNTDQAFCHNWLRNLRQHVAPNRVVAAVPIEPANCAWHSKNFGLTTEADFQRESFDQFCQSISQPGLRPEADLEIWHRATSMPWLVPSPAWRECGSWKLTTTGLKDSPDVTWFTRIHDAGYEFCVALDCIAYHVGAYERNYRRPPGSEHMQLEGET